MELKEIILISLAALFALSFVFFKYFYKNKLFRGYTYFLAGFRFISLFCLLLLIINPQFRNITYILDKPDLIVAIDHSLSIEKDKSEVEKIIQYLKDKKVQDKYDVVSYQFSDELQPLSDSLNYDGNSTNIFSALNTIDRTRPEGNSKIILVSDGKQNYGEDFQYFKNRQNVSINSVVIGDTTNYPDLYISNFNVNKYAFLDNKFPIELFLNYSDEDDLNTTFSISENGKILQKSPIAFSKGKKSQIANLELNAGSVGNHIYTVTLKKMDSEKNTLNNSIKFAVEVIDEQTKVVIFTSVYHPDLGMLKKSIEANKQRAAEIKYIQDFKNLELSKYQLVILYQPTNQFNALFSEISRLKLNYLLITGTATDWNYLNSLKLNFTKDYIPQSQDYLPIFNPGFSIFQLKDLGFNNFPPLKDKFGTIETSANFDVILFQNINGIATNLPLLMTSSHENRKIAYLLGENIWKWRSQHYVDNGSFEGFDEFIGQLIQFLASSQKKERLIVQTEPFYQENEEIRFNAQYFDDNFNFKPDSQLVLTIKDSLGKKVNSSLFIPAQNNYSNSIQNLPAGTYSYEVRPETENITKTGSFNILDFNTELLVSSSNYSAMKYLANENNGKTYLASDFDDLISNLLTEEDSKPIERSREKTVSLIDWQYLLVIIVLAASAEWFTRKYFGLI